MEKPDDNLVTPPDEIVPDDIIMEANGVDTSIDYEDEEEVVTESEYSYGFTTETAQDYFDREARSTAKIIGYDPRTGEDLNLSDDEIDQTVKGEASKRLDRDEAVMRRYLAVKYDKPEYLRREDARDNEEWEQLEEVVNDDCFAPVHYYAGGNAEFDNWIIPHWVPLFDPEGWVGVKPHTIRLVDCAATMVIARVESNRHKRRYQITIKKDNKKFTSYLIGYNSEEDRIWVSVLASGMKKAKYFNKWATCFDLEITNKAGDCPAAVLRGLKHTMGTGEYLRNYWEIELVTHRGIMHLLIGMSREGKMYCNKRLQDKNGNIVFGKQAEETYQQWLAFQQ